jgi:molybdate transport system ATP-binding protein
MSLAFDIALTRGDYALDAQADIGAGITILFGPSGAGKSLLLSALAGLVKAERATLTLNGFVLEDSAAGVRTAPHERGLGLMFQTPRLFPHLNVAENLAYAEHRAPPDKRRLSVEDAAQRFDFAHLLARNVGALSGGEKARVALARALLSAPDLLMLDEPFAALDGVRRRAFLAELKAIHADYGLPLLVVTHQIEDAAFLADDVIALKDGRIVAQGAATPTFADPAFQALLDPRDSGAAIHFGEMRAWVRADHVLLATEGPRGISARHVWKGRIASLTAARADTISVQLETESGALFAHVTPEAAQELNLHAEQNVWVIVKAHSAR